MMMKNGGFITFENVIGSVEIGSEEFASAQ